MSAVTTQLPARSVVPAASRGLMVLSSAFAAAALALLALLHVLSPELDPSWHMVSEYAFGAHGTVLSVFFWCWGLASMTAALAVLFLAERWAQRLGGALVFLSGVGAVAGGLFDVKHELHGLAFALGVPTLPIGALLLTGLLAGVAPSQRTRLRVAAHATWLAILVMGVAMAMFIASLKAAGAFHPESKEVLAALPDGVTSVSGYANRLLIMVDVVWLLAAGAAVRAGQP